MPVITVQKFGGTSVAGTDALKRAAGRIVAAREAGQRVLRFRQRQQARAKASQAIHGR
jgi:hypothetical protein